MLQCALHVNPTLRHSKFIDKIIQSYVALFTDVAPSGNSVFLYPTTDEKKTNEGSPKESTWQRNNAEEVSSWRRGTSMKKAFEGETGSVGSVSSETDEVKIFQKKNPNFIIF